jgi:hypothetical protein
MCKRNDKKEAVEQGVGKLKLRGGNKGEEVGGIVVGILMQNQPLKELHSLPPRTCVFAAVQFKCFRHTHTY